MSDDQHAQSGEETERCTVDDDCDRKPEYRTKIIEKQYKPGSTDVDTWEKVHFCCEKHQLRLFHWINVSGNRFLKTEEI